MHLLIEKDLYLKVILSRQDVVSKRSCHFFHYTYLCYAEFFIVNIFYFCDQKKNF